MKEQIERLLSAITHPETEKNIVDSGFVGAIIATEEKISVSLTFTRARDPFAIKLKNQVEQSLKKHYPAAAIIVSIRESEPKKVETKKSTTTSQIANIVAIASGKGGVGKSTITANLAISLRDMGYRVGVLDADIYGPSQPKMFNLEAYIPEAVQVEGVDIIVPATSQDIKIMSIGFFIKSTDALLWRGAMATNALKQMIHQTEWGELDFLLIDLPPGTGDIHLSIIGELNIDGAVIVSTPQSIAIADVVRGVEMFRNKSVNIPILGIIENMAWFTPAELPENRYYIFGNGGAKKFATENGVNFLGEIPIIGSIMEGADGGNPASITDSMVAKYYKNIAKKVVDNLVK